MPDSSGINKGALDVSFLGKRMSTTIAGACAITATAFPVAAIPRLELPTEQPNMANQVRWYCNDDRQCRDIPDALGGYIIRSGPDGGLYIIPDHQVVPRKHYRPRHYDDRYSDTRGYSLHVEWCLDRYRSYDPRSNTYMTYSGIRRYCRSPYD